MPTANSAASSQPTNMRVPRTRPQFRRVAMSGLGLVIALSSLFAAETISAPAAAASAGPCSGWNSTTRPPDYIRVLRRSTGRVVRVPFKKYVVTVMGKEWPSYLPEQVIDAGAVAVKQFAWYHALGRARVSRRGQCFDVTDGVGDQLYKPGKARVRPIHYAAVNKTWDVRLLKDGRLFMTGYRTGSKHHCGSDRTGWKLYARSAVRCARRGMSYMQILRIYYGPVSVTRWGNGAGGGAASVSDSSVTIETFSAPAALSAEAGQTGGVSLNSISPAVVAPATEISQNAFTAG